MADSDRYSDGWDVVDLATLPAAVCDAIREIDAVAGPSRVLRWNERFVAVAIDLRIDLPTRGPIDGLDIRRVEPVMVLIDTRDFPFDAPDARINRKSFPVDKVPHLNPVKPGAPPWPCLHRGSIDDWFAEHGMRELIERMRGWFRDAARGRLMRDGDVFEPTRPEVSRRTMSFAANAIDRIVMRSWGQTQEPGHGFTMARVGGDSVKHTGWHSSIAVSLLPFLMTGPDAELIDLARGVNAGITDPNEIQRIAVAVCAWTGPTPVSTYFGRLPSTYGELLTFADGVGIPLRVAIDELGQHDGLLLKGIPVVLGIHRPRPLQGSRSQVEWLCFMIVSDDEPDPQDVVLSLGHREPLTPVFARSLSGITSVSRLERPLIVGCGAIGSKLALHLAKAGYVRQRLVDHALLTPHHVVRHGLIGDYLGKPKAEGVREAIISLYPGQRELGTECLNSSFADIVAESAKLEDRTILIDATASASVQNHLVQAVLPSDLRVCRIEIADQGRLGLLAYEGRDRNPRLDDIQLHLLDLARSDATISMWLRTHGKEQPAFEDIGIGLGCSSETLRLADDVVSHHAAAFSRTLRRLADEDRGHLVVVDERDDTSSTRSFTISPVLVLPVEGRPDWSVRISASAVAAMRAHLDMRGHRESGGLLVGYAHGKRKIMYVSHVLKPSRDSRGTRSGFVRGVEGYPAAIDEIEQRTGGLLGYVGEWHTHPTGSTKPSPIDHGALAEIQHWLDAAGLPGVIVIVGPLSITAAMQAVGESGAIS